MQLLLQYASGRVPWCWELGSSSINLEPLPWEKLSHAAAENAGAPGLRLEPVDRADGSPLSQTAKH
jgi:hypothetical protein